MRLVRNVLVLLRLTRLSGHLLLLLLYVVCLLVVVVWVLPPSTAKADDDDELLEEGGRIIVSQIHKARWRQLHNKERRRGGTRSGASSEE